MNRRQFHHCALGLLTLASPLGRTASAAAGPAGGGASIPANTWVSRKLPGPGMAPYRAAKDMRMAFNPEDEQLYLAHGDWSGPWGDNSGRQEMYSYHVGRDEWTLVHPYCMGEGHVQPSGPDELGWAYDSNRKIFWMIPGFQWESDCPSAVHGKVMTFDPRSRTWEVVPGIERIRTDVLYSHYDAVEDTILTLAWDGGRGAAIDILDCDERRMRRVAFRGTVQDARISKEYSAMDLRSRTIYAIDGLRGDFYAYEMDAKKLSKIGKAPHRPGRQNSVILAWDSTSGVLLWPYGDTMYIYHPDSDRWETQQPGQPEGHKVWGNSAGYDPVRNAMIYMGRQRDMEHIFLYRYQG